MADKQRVVGRRAGTLILAIGCCTSVLQSQEPVPRDAVVARLGEETITVGDLLAELQRRARGRPGAFGDVAERRAVVNQLLLRRLELRAARAAGLERDPQVVRSLEAALLRRYDQIVESRFEPPEITDVELEAAYRAEQERWQRPGGRRAALVLLPPTTEVERLEALRATLAALPSSGRDLAAFVVEHSRDRATRYATGDSGWLSPRVRYRWPGAVVEGLFALEEVGAVSEAVVGPEGVWIAKLIEIQLPSAPPLEDVADVLRAEIVAAALEAHVEAERRRLLEQGEAQIDTELLEALRLPEPTPPALPASSPDREDRRR